MHEILLHHYAGSPFAEKVRTLLGHQGLAWRSVPVPPVPPRPSLQPALGDFRRTPVLQIGADYFCDTRLIADVVDHLAGQAPDAGPAAAIGEMLQRWVEPRVFVMLGPLRFRSAADVDGVFGGNVSAAAFAADRRPFMAPAIDVRRFRERAAEAADHLHHFLDLLDGLLAGGQPFLCGPSPTRADFTAWHPVWWLRLPPARDDLLAAHPQLAAWADRMDAIGHGRPLLATPAMALQAAIDARTSSRWQAPWPGRDDDRLGREVELQADDYGRDPLLGRLVASSARHLTIERDVPALGAVRVHFPTLGYEVVSAADAAQAALTSARSSPSLARSAG